MITRRKYAEEKINEWDEFVKFSSASTLHSSRKFLNYHQKKFNDSSLMFYQKNHLVGVLPGVIKEKTYISHPGASYGGLIYKEGLKINYLFEIHEQILNFCRENGVCKLEFRFPYSIISKHYYDAYKYILNNHPSTVYKEVSQFIDLLKFKDKNYFSENFTRIIKKNSELITSITKNYNDIENFYNILSENLIKHNTKPTHELSELNYLIENLDEKVLLFVTKDSNSNIVSGSLAIQLNNETSHLFYLGTNIEYLSYSPLVNTVHDVAKYFKSENFRFLNLGISTESKGSTLNSGLNNFKEKFNTSATSRETIVVDIK